MANRAQVLFDRAREHPERTAIVFEGEALRYGDLANRVRTTAAALADAGVGRGVRIGVMLPSTPDFIIVQQAIFMLGAVFSPLNVFYRQGEVAHAVQICALQLLVVSADLLDRVPGERECPGLAVLSIGTVGPAARSATPLSTTGSGAAPVTLAPVERDDVVMLLSTSATTGKAKGVMLTAGNLAANYDRTPEWLGLHAGSTILCALPLYNTFGLNQCINAMLVLGATMVLLPRFDAGRCVEAIGEAEHVFFPAVPTMLQKVVDHPDAADGALHGLERIMTGGAPVPAPLLQRVLAAAPRAEVLTGYGLTEATALVTLTPVRLDKNGALIRGKTIGRVLAGMQIRIEQEDGRVVGPGIVGEISVRGPNLMQGYFNAPEETAAAIPDGWLRTGDLGYLDVQGYGYIVDRKKDVIIRGGQNIYPADIEEVLYRQPGVAEAAVVAGPDAMLGEVPIAFVALRPGAGLTELELLERCREQLAHFKVPAEVHILRELPKGPTGKILRRELRPVAEERAVA